MKRIFFNLLVLIAPCTGVALEVDLESVTGKKSRGEIRFSLDNKAIFDFDPDTNTLTSKGTWIALNKTGPNELYRYSHKVENFIVSAENGFSAKSYECVEGTFGAMILRNYCGNYNFGSNMTDDGGFVDDKSSGLPISLYYFEVSLFEWDSEKLVVILSPKDPDRTEAYPELSLTLTFVVPPDEDRD